MAGAPTTLNNMGLTPKRAEFVKHFTNKNNPKTYLNQTESARVSYGHQSANANAVEGNRVLRDANANRTIREILGKTEGLREKISNNLQQIIDEGLADKSQRRHALQAIELICKITGEYAPERHEIGPMSVDERKDRLTQIADSIKQSRTIVGDSVGIAVDDVEPDTSTNTQKLDTLPSMCPTNAMDNGDTVD